MITKLTTCFKMFCIFLSNSEFIHFQKFNTKHNLWRATEMPEWTVVSIHVRTSSSFTHKLFEGDFLEGSWFSIRHLSKDCFQKDITEIFRKCLDAADCIHSQGFLPYYVFHILMNKELSYYPEYLLVQIWNL